MYEALVDRLLALETQQRLRAFDLPSFGGEHHAAYDFALYVSLVSELFDLLRVNDRPGYDWSGLGNALLSLGSEMQGTGRIDAHLFSATAFHAGGYPASAALAMKQVDPQTFTESAEIATFDLLTHNVRPGSQMVARLVDGVRIGDAELIRRIVDQAKRAESDALTLGPDEWVSRRLLRVSLEGFAATNIRAVLPDGWSGRWNPLVDSLIRRRRWEFFPSQIEAISAGLLTTSESYALQMPTGAGKTALIETLLFSHLQGHPASIAIVVTPFRALAREMRVGTARHLTKMGFRTRTVYGGTVPTREELADLSDVRALISTPESLAGLMAREPDIFSEASLVVVDEGHLLDAPGRGIALELLLSRFLAREYPPKFAFVSAIVPNIEDINLWLGGASHTAIRSTYSPAELDYAVLRPSRTRPREISLAQHLSGLNRSIKLSGFLTRSDFQYTKSSTRRVNTYGYDTDKTLAVATARKSLLQGTVAVFAAKKRGPAGVIGLAEELVKQIKTQIPLPDPLSFVPDDERDSLHDAVDYFEREFGRSWSGAAVLRLGAAIHHGDLPQEVREVVEDLLRRQTIRLVFCTSTLAEGVNFPIRTLVLYSLQRGKGDRVISRDIKNLVGRAGRAGYSTRGVVICANKQIWTSSVRAVARGRSVEPVRGALAILLAQLEEQIAIAGLDLTNSFMEEEPRLFQLIDGVDSMLLELISAEIGSEQFRSSAQSVIDATYVSHSGGARAAAMLKEVVALRVSRILDLKSNGRIRWAVGAKVRLVDSVADELYPAIRSLGDPTSVLNEDLWRIVMGWAWRRPEFTRAWKQLGYEESDSRLLTRIVLDWLSGSSYERIAANAEVGMDELLRVHAKMVSHELVGLIEQAVTILQQIAIADDWQVPVEIDALPESLRHGVSSGFARSFATRIRHRSAAVELGEYLAEVSSTDLFALIEPEERASTALVENPERWTAVLGEFVYQRTLDDLGVKTVK